MTLRLSATSILAYLNCPRKFWLRWQEKIRPAVEAEALVTGTHYHKAHEVWRNAPAGEEIAALTAFLNATFTQGEDAAVKQQVLMRQILAYQHVWSVEPLKILAVERPFEFQLANCMLVGKIDAIIERHGLVMALEMKTSGSDICDEDYWDDWTRNVQASIYALALKRLFGKKAGGVLVDVVRKPTIRPKLLSRGKDSTGERESPEQYGERLSADMQENPTKYFARREVGRTDAELAATERNIGLIADAIIRGEELEPYANFLACKNPYPCEYASICHDRTWPANLAELGPGFVCKATV